MRQRILMVLLAFTLASACAARADNWNVELVGKTPGTAYDVFILDNYAYLCAGAVLIILDISDPANPTEVGRAYLPDIALGAYVSGGYAYVADGESGLRVIDVSDLSNPKEVGFYDTPGVACEVYMSGGYAYVADWEAGLQVIDISNPINPHEMGFYDTPRYVGDIQASGGYAYVADSGGGLRVIDISNPSSPQEVGSYGTPGEARGVCVSGGYAYVADGFHGLRIIDISIPSNPKEVGFYYTNRYAWDVHVSGSYAYVADYWDGLWVIDISDPSNPKKVGIYDTPGNTLGVYVSGDYAYVTAGEGGLLILRYTGTLQYEMELKPGWNLISIPIELVNNTMDEVLHPIADRCNAVWAYDAGDDEWRYYFPDGSSFPNTLLAVETGEGYWVNMDTFGTLTFDGGTICDDHIFLKREWNLVGYNSGVARSVEDALSSVIGNVLSVWAYDSSEEEWKWRIADAPEFFNSLQIMGPWKGYWIEVEADCTWVVP